MKFTKMHGCGNDYVYVNCFTEKVNDPEDLARKISDRHFGIGSDGLILILPPDDDTIGTAQSCTDGRNGAFTTTVLPASGRQAANSQLHNHDKRADAFMQLYNADGCKGSMCGNGIRCVAKYVYDHGLIPADRTMTRIATPSGVKEISLDIRDGKVINATVDMGCAKVDSPSRAYGEILESINIKGRDLKFIGVDVGNDHAVYFVEDNPEISDVMTWPDSKFADEGKYFETHSRFPRRVNSDFIEIISREEINMRVYERGSGETWACGTGATASVFAGVVSGKLERNKNVLVHLRGGDLRIKVDDSDKCFMTGPAVEVFSGEYNA